MFIKHKIPKVVRYDMRNIFISVVAAFLLISCAKYKIVNAEQSSADGRKSLKISVPEFKDFDCADNDIQQIKNEYIKDYESAKDNISEQIPNAPVVLDIQGEVFETKDYTSVKLTIMEFFGGAHPNTHIQPLVYDNDKCRRVGFEDVFSRSILKPLSKKAYEAVKNKIGEEYFGDFAKDWAKRGTAPRTANFRDFILNRDGAVFYIERYQAAAYVYGAFEILMSKKELAPHLKQGAKR